MRRLAASRRTVDSLTWRTSASCRAVRNSSLSKDTTTLECAEFGGALDQINENNPEESTAIQAALALRLPLHPKVILQIFQNYALILTQSRSLSY